MSYHIEIPVFTVRRRPTRPFIYVPAEGDLLELEDPSLGVRIDDLTGQLLFCDGLNANPAGRSLHDGFGSTH